MEDVIVARPQHFEWFDNCYHIGPHLVDSIQVSDLCKYVSPFKNDPEDGEMMTVVGIIRAADLYSQHFNNELQHRRKHRLPRKHSELVINIGGNIGGDYFRKESMLAQCLTGSGLKWISFKQLKIVS
jgi:hypothetical protein